jgi:streptogramin lyase
LLASLLGVLIICQGAGASSASNNSPPAAPQSGSLKLVAQLPAELPQRVLGLAYDGQKLWVSVYHGRGRYATLDPSSLQWTIGDARRAHIAIGAVSGSFESPGAICFANGKLWVAGSYGDSFGSIDTRDWKVENIFKGKQRENERASQSYSSMVYDGSNLWIAWHWFRYDLPAAETQLLLKVDPATGKVVEQFPAPAGSRPDGAHGLAWDGWRLWHAKDDTLTAIDPANGRIIDRYIFDQLKRPSGLAWDGQALWIAEFDGKIWRLPLD